MLSTRPQNTVPASDAAAIVKLSQGHEPSAKVQRLDENNRAVDGCRTAAEITTLQVKRLSQHAVLPCRGSEKAAGYDLARCLCPCE